jgi:ParB family chromosome partitioning protein
MALSISHVPVDQIVTAETPRLPGDGLVRSMDRFGQLIAVDLRAQADGTYRLEDGHRRLGAARKLGWNTIRGVVEAAGADSLATELKTIIVNTQRQNLRQLDIARHVRRLVQEGGYSQAELARQIDVSKFRLCRMLKVLDCPELVSAIEDAGLEFGAAYAVAVLTVVERKQVLEELLKIQARDGKLPSVRQVKERVCLRQGSRPLPEVLPADLPTALDALQLQDFPMEVEVTRGKQSRVKVTLVLADQDQEWVSACLTEIGERGATVCPPARDTLDRLSPVFVARDDGLTVRDGFSVKELLRQEDGCVPPSVGGTEGR